MDGDVHEHRVQTRWTDFDVLGHLTHAVVFAFLDEARDALLTALVGDFDAWPTVVARVEADFRREVPRGPRELLVRTRVAGVGRSSVRFAQELVGADGELAVESASVLVAFDPGTRTSRRISEQDRARLSMSS